jgi:hypothetical protein
VRTHQEPGAAGEAIGRVLHGSARIVAFALGGLLRDLLGLVRISGLDVVELALRRVVDQNRRQRGVSMWLPCPRGGVAAATGGHAHYAPHGRRREQDGSDEHLAGADERDDQRREDDGRRWRRGMSCAAFPLARGVNRIRAAASRPAPERLARE